MISEPTAKTLITRRVERLANGRGWLDGGSCGSRRPGLAPGAIAFLEVSGYSRLSETRQEDASDFPVRLGDIVLDSMAYGGRALSVLADLVMLTFPDPTQAYSENARSVMVVT